MDDITVTLEAAGFRCIKLGVAFAFHSAQTDPILDDFEAACKNVQFHEPKLPVISPLVGKVVFDGRTFNAHYVRRATREVVDCVSALESAYNVSIADDTIWIEIGPHPVCVGFIKTTLPSTVLAVPSLSRGADNWKTMSETMAALHLAGVDLNWNEFHRPFADRVNLLTLPSYAWDEKRYWLQYNGDWCLTKGNTYYHDNLETTKGAVSALPAYESVSSLVQNIIDVDVDGAMGTVVMQSDLMQKDFLAAAHGHQMNGCGVVTSVSLRVPFCRRHANDLAVHPCRYRLHTGRVSVLQVLPAGSATTYGYHQPCSNIRLDRTERLHKHTTVNSGDSTYHRHSFGCRVLDVAECQGRRGCF